jgi:hypothetical protein
LVASPAEPEAKLSLAAIGDLLDPFLEEVRALLPPPQRRALEVALLLAEAEGRTPLSFTFPTPLQWKPPANTKACLYALAATSDVTTINAVGFYGG